MEQATIVIDGECGLCQRASHYGMRRAAPGLLRFITSQSAEGMDLLRRHGLADVADKTMVAVVGKQAYTESAAAVQVAKRLRWPWRVQAGLWLVPKPVRDAGYRWISRRRKRFGASPPGTNH